MTGATPAARARYVVWPDGLILPVISGATDDAAPDPSVAPPVDPSVQGAPAPTGEPPAATTMDEAADLGRRRLLGNEPPEALVPDGALYRDVVPIREQIAQTREQYAPIAQVFDGVSQADRDAFLGAPGVADDLSLVTGLFTTFPAEDRRYFLEILNAIPDDPEGAAEHLAAIAEELRGGPPSDAPVGPGAPAAGADDFDMLGFARDDPQRPLTKAEIEDVVGTKLSEFATAQARQAADAEADRVVRDELKDLGYDPDSNDMEHIADVETVIALARRLPDRSLAKADALIKARDQRAIDRFVEARTADAGRPQPPAGGAPPTGERRPETLDDAAAAGRERLEQAGLLPRRG